MSPTLPRSTQLCLPSSIFPQGFQFLPKTECDVCDVEIARALRLRQSSIEPVAFRVPRVKVECRTGLWAIIWGSSAGEGVPWTPDVAPLHEQTYPSLTHFQAVLSLVVCAFSCQTPMS